MRWARDAKDTRTRAEYYPDIDKRLLFLSGYISNRSGHSRGSTVDLTLVRLTQGQPPADIDMGTRFDFFGPQSSAASRQVSEAARSNRALLAAAMRKRGFVAYHREWWHFTLRSEPYPNQYFDFVVE